MRPTRDRLKVLAGRAAELAAAFASVLVCFVVFLGVLGLSFPRGTSLRDLTGYDPAQGAVHRGGLRVELGPGAQSRLPLVASLARVFRQVKERPPDAIAWSDAASGKALRDRHAVQTFARSGATIVFGRRHGLQLSEKSLIILKRLEEEPETRSKRAALVLMEGELSARLEPLGGEQIDLSITTGDAEFQIASHRTRPADFKLTVDSDERSTIAVYDGEARVTAEGRTVRIAPNHAVTVLPGRAPGPPVLLAARPVVVGPANGFQRHFREDAAEVRFDWDAQSEAEGYRFMLARDRQFADVVHDGRLAEAGFAHGRLGAGTYYWRVSALRDGVEGLPSATRSLTLLQDREPPALRVEGLPRVVDGDSLLLQGTTEPGSRVLIGHREAVTDVNGAFVEKVALALGQNVIVVETIDAAGNIAYHSSIVTARHSEKTP